MLATGQSGRYGKFSTDTWQKQTNNSSEFRFNDVNTHSKGYIIYHYYLFIYNSLKVVNITATNFLVLYLLISPNLSVPARGNSRFSGLELLSIQ